MTPLANILHRSTIEALVGQNTLARGEAYFRQGRVEELLRKASSLEATVRGEARYGVRIWISADGLAYSCSCPFGTDGHFCKHAVATAIAWIDQARAPQKLEERLRAMGKEALLAVLLKLAGHDETRGAIEAVLEG